MLPVAASAVTIQVYNFREGQLTASWSGIGPLEKEWVADGLRLTTGSESGVLVTQHEPPFLADMGSLFVTSEEDVRLQFVWSFRVGSENVTHSAPIFIDANTALPQLFSLSRHVNWVEGPKTFGILIPPNSSLILHRMDLSKLTMGEKIRSIIGSFWTFDEYRPYSINFLWGPVFGTNPAEMKLLYRFLPPQFTMGTWVVHLLLAASLLAGAVTYSFLKKKIIGRILFFLVLGMWVLLDLRMGSEFLSWVQNDQRTYIAAAPGTREFRDRDRFYDFAEFAKPLIQDRSRYIFLAEVPWPYLGNMRYLTYPILPAFNLKEDDTWVIYRRPDIAVSQDGQLVFGQTVVSEPGQILGSFDKGSFIFRGKPLSQPAE